VGEIPCRFNSCLGHLMFNFLDFPIQFRTIVVDPPWTPKMSIINGNAPKASPQKFYPTMSVDEICEIKPPIASQAHIYMWCVAQHVNWAYDVVAAWGAEPIILWTWKKPGLGVGRFRCNTEHVLLARVGSRHGNPFGDGGRHSQATEGTCFEWPRGKHSEKPQEFFDLVEKLSPAPRLEMYARVTRTGWYGWGNEVGMVDPAGEILVDCEF
jgi:N6-adenosine-specific RNA methylase IME4